jgi:DNA replicative helicase MCM subunit Mcm2 (Cdc46/Mcm family)
MLAVEQTLKPTTAPECPICKGSLRLVWVKVGKETTAANKCKCGTILYDNTPQNARLDDFREPQRRKERDRLTVILDIVRELEKEFNAPVEEALIMQRAYEEGISELETSGALERLKLDGQIYDPNRNGRYKVV